MMGSFQPSDFQLLYLLIAALLYGNVATQRPCKQVHRLNINYVQGDNMSISCLTTTHPLQSLRVKLRRTDPIKDILMYSDTSPASEHQKWSVRNDAGNVTLYLKDISLSDQGHYECEVYRDWDCLSATLINLKVKECKTLDSVHATLDSSVLLPCSEHPLQHNAEQVTWKIIIGHKPTKIDEYRPPNKPSNSTEKVPRPLYERVIIQGNGSLLIRDAVNTDGSWYQCRVSEKTCYEVKLLMKECKTLDSVHATPNSSVLLPCSEHPLQHNAEQVTWTIIIGHKPTKIDEYRPPNKPSNSTEKVPRPLYERVIILGNGSLLIRDAVNTDGSWYQCRVSEKTCYEVKLVMKDAPTTADIPVVQTEGNIDTSAAVTTDLTAVVMVTIVSLCVLIALIICGILYFRKGTSKINNQTELNYRHSPYYSEIPERLDVPLYSVVQRT